MTALGGDRELDRLERCRIQGMLRGTGAYEYPFASATYQHRNQNDEGCR